MSAGKGDTPRPVNAEKYRKNYDAIFRKTKDFIKEYDQAIKDGRLEDAAVIQDDYIFQYKNKSLQ